MRFQNLHRFSLKGRHFPLKKSRVESSAFRFVATLSISLKSIFTFHYLLAMLASPPPPPHANLRKRKTCHDSALLELFI